MAPPDRTKHWDLLLPRLFRSSTGQYVAASEALGGKQFVGLYFSAPWCGYCVRFTPFLKALYSQAPKDKLEIVLVSSCSNVDEHHQFVKDLPWYEVPFEEAEKIGYIRKSIRDQLGKPQGRLATSFGICSLPSLVILDSNGKVVRQDGRQDFQDQSHITDVLKVWEGLSRNNSDKFSIPWTTAGLALACTGGIVLLRNARSNRH